MFVFYFILGACFGSFIPCFAQRRYEHQSQFERSHCMYCGRPIAPLYLIPIIGYCFNRGRCHVCQKPIPKILPCLELFGALIGVLLTVQTIYTLRPFGQLLIASMLLLMSLDDYYTQWIHDSDLILYGVFILFDAICFDSLWLPDRLLGTCIITLPLLLIYWRFSGALGSGDILFMALSGFYLGVVDITYAFLIGIISALLYSARLLLQHRATKESAIPLIPFLSIGVLSMMIF